MRSACIWLCYLPLPKMQSCSIFDRIEIVLIVLIVLIALIELIALIALIVLIVENALCLYIAMQLATAQRCHCCM
jgi:hypothetical protein